MTRQMMKAYVLIGAMLALIYGIYGWAAPALVSANFTALVVLGLVLMFTGFPILYVMGDKAYRLLKAENESRRKLRADAAAAKRREMVERQTEEQKQRPSRTRRFAHAAAVMLLALTAAACDRVEPGQVGIKVFLLGDSKGVDHEVLGPGRYWIGMNERLYLFPTFTQNYVWAKGERENESITFQTVEGLDVNADIGITYSLDPAKIPTIFQRYRRGVEEITDIYLRNIVRDALVTVASSKSVEYIYGAGKAEVVKIAEAMVREEVASIGIKVENLYAIGTFRLPPKVVEAINAKIEATQRAQQRANEVAEAKAAADKKVEEARGEAESITLKAQAQAEANKKLAASITPTLVQYEMIQKWNGVMPLYAGEGGNLLLQLPAQK